MASSKTSPEQLITDSLDIWTAAIEQKSSAGRGSSKKYSLHGIKKLRELILELAVRGKLVSQDPNDEPASVLLKRIAAEKAQLIKEGKLKKQKPLPEITEEEKPFELPNGWEWSYLQEISSYIQRGKSPQYSEVGSVKVVSQKCVQNLGFNVEAARFITSESLEKYQEERYLQNNDILWNSTGTGTVGRANVIDSVDSNMLVADSHVTVIRPYKTYSRFLWCFIMAPGIQSRINPDHDNSLVSGSTKQVELNTSSVSSVVIPVPPIQEQHRIVAKVDELMSLCDALEAQTENSISAHQTIVITLLDALLLPTSEGSNNDSFQNNWQRISEHFDALFTTTASIDALKQTILQLAVMGKLVPQDSRDEPASKLLERIAAEKAQLIKDKKIKKSVSDDSIIVDNCSWELALGWSFSELQNIFKFIDYRGKNPNKSPSGIRIITAKNIRNGFIKNEPVEFITEELYEQWMVRGIPQKRDILFITEGHTMGFVAQIDLDYKFALAQRTICLQRFSDLVPEYLCIALMSKQFQSAVKDNETGSAAGGIKASKLKRLTVPIPPFEEQHRIVTKVDELMSLCDSLKARLTDAQTTQLYLADTLVKEAL